MGEDGLKYLVDQAKLVKMSPDQETEQRRSFAFGNAAFENERITREMINEEDEKLSAQK